jgi:hypothetical protein
MSRSCVDGDDPHYCVYLGPHHDRSITIGTAVVVVIIGYYYYYYY